MSSSGGSKWTTQATPSTWMPRAATSVAIRAWACPRLNASRARDRWFWLRPPWMASALTPAFSSWRVSRSAPWRVRVKTMVGPAAIDGVAGVVDAVLVPDAPEVVRHGVEVGLDLAHLVAGRLVLVAAGQLGDVAVEGGREQQRLAVVAGLVEQALDHGQEAHVGHAVGFVDDDERHVGERDVAALDQVLEAAGAGDEDVDALAEGLDLRAVAHAAVHGVDEAPGGLAEGQELLADLLGQLAGGRQDERGRPTGLGLGRVGEGGDAEGQGLARARGRPAADVAAGEGIGDGGRLDGEGGGHAALGEGGGEVVGHAEISEEGGRDGVVRVGGVGDGRLHRCSLDRCCWRRTRRGSQGNKVEKRRTVVVLPRILLTGEQARPGRGERQGTRIGWECANPVASAACPPHTSG